jgi:transposase
VGLLASNLSTVRILEELQGQGFEGSYGSLSRYIRIHNIKKNTCIRFHTTAGEEAQVDFGDIGKRYDNNGKLRKAYIFNMRLSYSRLDYYEVVFDQKIDTWINCHINAYNFFGGVPQIIKLDNLKSGVLNANFYEPVYQKEYQRLAQHYGCWLSACRPYQPQEKGKVESGIKYVKNNFFAGREFSTNQEMNKQLARWLSSANERIHGTTKSKPSELFVKEEAASLIKLPLELFNMSFWHTRKVAKDCHITLDNNYYSVPAKYISKEVTISLSAQLVKIYVEEEIVAIHARAKGHGIFTTNISHYAKNKIYCPGFIEHDKKYQEEMANMGANCTAMLGYIQQEHKKDWHRAVKGIIKLRKFYSDEVIDKACLRALHYGVSSYTKIKKILENNCYNLPLGEYSGEGRYANIA